MKKTTGIDWPNLTDDQVVKLRDYDSSSKVRRRARHELGERSAMRNLRDAIVQSLAEAGEDPDTRIRAQHEWKRRKQKAQAREAEHATSQA